MDHSTKKVTLSVHCILEERYNLKIILEILQNRTHLTYALAEN